MFRHVKHIHFIGIGGIGMSGLAELLLNKNYIITGSDIRKSEITEKLEKLGAKIYYEHKKENIGKADIVVYSSAIKGDNDEIIEAKKRKIPVISRIEMLGEVMRMKESIAIAGTHGKTTTTAMIGKILQEANLDPTIIVGGQLKTLGINVKLGEGKFIVCEVDESDKLLVSLSPIINVITSIDEDHLDKYKDIEEIRKTFIKFTNRVPFYGCNILYGDDENIKKIINKVKKRRILYGFGKDCNIRILEYETGLSSKFKLKGNGIFLGEFNIRLPGIHNILNATAAIATAMELEIPIEIVKKGIKDFDGVHRRFEIVKVKDGVTYIDDYAHHPTEIKATLDTAKLLYPNSRIIVIFQPHLYSRTMKLKDKFAIALSKADIVIITTIYPAREKPIKGVTGKIIVEEAKKLCKNFYYLNSNQEIVNMCKSIVNEGDIVFLMGAGDINKLINEL